MNTVLTIAGSDSCGGAGIEADIKTITMNGAYAMTAITALTAQNTLGVRGVFESSPDFISLQLDAIFEDIFPDAVKIGMVASGGLVEAIAERLRHYSAKNIVIDPVMVSTSGSKLIKSDTLKILTEKLFPLAKLITPNIPETEALTGLHIESKSDMEKAAKLLGDTFSCAILLKGGHNSENADDLLYEKGILKWFSGNRIDTPNTHGTGCTLSSAIASNLAKGFNLVEAVSRSKEYVADALSAKLNLGKGSGPLMHNFNLYSHFTK